MKTLIKKNLYFENNFGEDFGRSFDYSGTKHLGGTAVYGGGSDPPHVDHIGYYKMGILSNSVDWGGELTASGSNWCAGVTDANRAVWTQRDSPGDNSTIDYVSIGTPGSNATDFGECVQATVEQGSVSGQGRGMTAGGGNPATDHRAYVTIGIASSATDFQELAGARRHTTGQISDGTMFLFAGGQLSNQNMIDKGQFFTNSDSTDFGNLDGSRAGAGGLTNNYRGVFTGGESNDHIQYVTIRTAGDAVDFGGELTRGTWGSPGSSDGSRGCTQGDGGTIDNVNIGVKGDAADFGEMFQSLTSFGVVTGN